jgi:hypothetical protein
MHTILIAASSDFPIRNDKCRKVLGNVLPRLPRRKTAPENYPKYISDNDWGAPFSKGSLTDAKRAEDAVEQVIGVDNADDLSKLIERDANFRGHEFVAGLVCDGHFCPLNCL